MTKKIGEVILDVNNISLRFGGVKALTDISFNVKEHEIRAIIGPNGAGKSSMLNCINGVYTPQEGSITFSGQKFDHMNSRQVAEMGIGCVFSEPQFNPGLVASVLQDAGVNTAVIDPQGIELELSMDLYPQMLERLGTS